LLLTNINNQQERKEIVIRYSVDEGLSWSIPKVIDEGEAAYSSMTQLSNGDVGIFYEADNYTSNIFKLLSIDWIISSK
jgi:sialidase-1